jgi:hypothetical protein
MSKLPESFSNKPNEEIDKEVELLKSKCILLESINADLRNEVEKFLKSINHISLYLLI